MDSKKKQFIIAGLRKATYRWKARYECKNNARRGKQRNKNNREVWVYECAMCKALFEDKQVQLDHIVPVVPVEGWDSWDGYLDRMFCGPEGYQVLCSVGATSCHKLKTQSENGIRKVNKKNIKKRINRKNKVIKYLN